MLHHRLTESLALLRAQGADVFLEDLLTLIGGGMLTELTDVLSSLVRVNLIVLPVLVRLSKLRTRVGETTHLLEDIFEHSDSLDAFLFRHVKENLSVMAGLPDSNSILKGAFAKSVGGNPPDSAPEDNSSVQHIFIPLHPCFKKESSDDPAPRLARFSNIPRHLTAVVVGPFFSVVAVLLSPADLTFALVGLTLLVPGHRAGRKVRVKIKQNLLWAAIYNLLAIPFAAGALYPAYGILLRPE